jgi:CheY-like chemotaxis protein
MTRLALVVDDSMLIRHTICRFLEERGYAVESATNGVDALERLKEIHPDILITDMMMPKMDGSQLITELKKHPSTARIPIILLAGRQSTAGHPPECRANATIWKDIDIVTQLERALRETLGAEV